ncbi:RNA polymerase sigma-70 factor [Larkinella sp. VNQ87]|uniref:RNA polymerase sigma-70 factor n=1 Tax=Larkinella sp. VNQ87 TaxID=3400921 RepID=UPI003C02ABA8
MSADSPSTSSVPGSRPLWPDSPAPQPGGQAVPDDEQFIRRVFEQNPQKGCELLFREYYGPLCSHASRFVYAREIARDLVSDTFYVFWQKELYKEITTSYRAYLYTAVRNRSIKYLQREFGKQIAVTYLDPSDEQDVLGSAEALTPEDLLTYDELHNRVEVAIGALSPQRQRVFLMNRFEGKKYQTIADELQISLKAVEAHISKALASLRKALQND